MRAFLARSSSSVSFPSGQMSASANTISEHRCNRVVLLVRILTWLVVALFLLVFLLLMPRGITVFSSAYLVLYGPVIGICLVAAGGFATCRLTGRSISVVYLLIALMVLVGVFCDTWFGIRLRWYELYQLFH